MLKCRVSETTSDCHQENKDRKKITKLLMERKKKEFDEKKLLSHQSKADVMLNSLYALSQWYMNFVCFVLLY